LCGPDNPARRAGGEIGKRSGLKISSVACRNVHLSRRGRRRAAF
jgi:hypothetical protein